MKALHKLCLFVLLLATAALWPRGHAGVPQPSYVLYGLASDEFGWPYLTNAAVTLWVNGLSNETHIVTGMKAPGVNFHFHVPLDSSLSGPLYSARAARPGDRIQITLLASGIQKTIITSTVLPPIGGPGQIRAINLTAGTDADGDGLPDEWEEWIIQNAHNPNLRTIFDVTPDGDADGDGISNINEYRAGTDPASAEDYFFLEQTGKSTNGRMQFTFLTIPGKTYQVISSDLSEPVPFQWQNASYSQSPDGTFDTAPIIGTGHFITVFTQTDDHARIVEVQVK